MEEHPHSNLFGAAITRSHWRLDPNWVEEADAAMDEFVSTHPELSDGWTDDLWQYMRNLFDVFPEPTCLTLELDLDVPAKTPLWKLTSRMTALTALELNWPADGDYGEDEDEKEGEPSSENALTKWLQALTPLQLLQLQHLSLDLLSCDVNLTELSEQLKQMPHLQSLTLLEPRIDEADTSLLKIPPLAEISQLYVSVSFPASQLELPVLPSLTKLSLLCRGDPEMSTKWIPNLAKLTALESLSWNALTVPDLLAMAHSLPPQLAHCEFSLEDGENTLNKLQERALWTDLMKLTQLTSLDVPHYLPFPDEFVQWMKTSQISVMPTYIATRSLEPLLAQALPAMERLRSMAFHRNFDESGDAEPLDWMAPILQQCTQLTQLEMDITPTEIPLFISALKGLRNLVELTFITHMEDNLPTDFFTLHFPNLTRLELPMMITDSNMSALADFLERHPSLTYLNISFDCKKSFEQSCDILSKCPSLHTLERQDERLTQARGKAKKATPIPKLPPTLRKLTWMSERDVNFALPEDHMLTHFQEDTFLDNVRRHETLVGLHTDWLAYFWPTRGE